MKGFVCINHFVEDDLYSTAKGICLKKNAIPKIFQNKNDGEHTDELSDDGEDGDDLSCGTHQIDEIDEIDGDNPDFSQTCDKSDTQTVQTNEEVQPIHSRPSQKHTECQGNCNFMNIMKAEHESLRTDFMRFQAEKNVIVEKLQHQIEHLKRDVRIQKDHIHYLNSKVYQQNKAKDSLKTLLRELQQQDILTKEALESLEVSYGLRLIHASILSFYAILAKICNGTMYRVS